MENIRNDVGSATGCPLEATNAKAMRATLEHSDCNTEQKQLHFTPLKFISNF